MKKAIGWFRVVLFASDILTDLIVVIELYDQCYHVIGFIALIFLLAPAFWCGGPLALHFGKKIIEDRYEHSMGKCGKFFVFIIGIIFGPVIYLTCGLYFLVSAAIDPENENVVVQAKM